MFDLREEFNRATAKQLAERQRREAIEKASREADLRERERRERFNLKNQTYLLALSPKAFEDAIAKMYRHLGYEVRQTPYSNDGGRDAVAVKDGARYSIECKHYNKSKPIGRPDLQKFFAAMKEDRARKGFFITTSRFTRTAIEYGRKNNIELIDLERLLSLMLEAFPQDSREW